MLGTRDIIFLIVVFSTMVAGVAWPDAARPLGAYLSWALMGLLFLAFLKVYPSAIWHTLRRYPLKMSMLVLTKLIVLPLIVYLMVINFFPDYALGLLLLAGVSSGLSAPFFSGLVGANIPLVLAMTVVTTLLLPLTLPLMVKILVGREININLFSLAGFMLILIFSPLLASLFSRRWLPRASTWVDEHSFAFSLILLATINLGAFGLYADFLREHRQQVVVSVLMGLGLAASMASTGLILFWSSPPTERVAAAGALGWINNVLVIVLGNYLNDPLTSVVAALYLVPYYALIIPLSHLTRIWKARDDFGELPYS
jgi:bile acid:Na+ symporter, BASS family